MTRVFLIVLGTVNLISFILMGYDKYCACKGKWRITEQGLLTWSACGGAVGVLLAMCVFRHKIRDWKFAWGVPGMLIVQLYLLARVVVK